MSMSVLEVCQLLRDKLGNPLFYGEQPTVESGPAGVPKLLKLIVSSSHAAKFVFYGSSKKAARRVESIRWVSQELLLTMDFVNHGDDLWKRDAAVALGQGLVSLRRSKPCDELDALWASVDRPKSLGVQDAILIGAAADAKAAAIVRDHFRGVVRDLSGPRGPGNQPSPPSAFVLQLADPGATLPRFCGSL